MLKNRIGALIGAILGRIFAVRGILGGISGRVVAAKFASLLLILSMLTTSTPAAPLQLMATINGLGQDIRYAYLTSPALASVGAYLGEIDLTDNFLFAFFLSGKKQKSIARIEVSPNRAAVREGEDLALTAVALDSAGNVIQGISFKWLAISQRKGAVPQLLQNGIFKPQSAGRFEVIAESSGSKGSAVIRVINDPYSLAMNEIDRQQKEKTGETRRGSKPRQIRQDVGKVLAEAKPFSFNNSTRMSVAEAKDLSKADSEHRKLNPNKPIIDPNKQNPVIKKAAPAREVSPNQVGLAELEEMSDAADGIREGGPHPADENENAGTKRFYPGISGSLNSITGTNITGCGYDGNGWSGAQIELYIDGGMYGGTYLGSTYAYSGCSFSYPIPGTYQNGQAHTVSAYIWDSNSYSYFELDNSPQSFQIGGGGGGTGTNANWNNTNAPTADDPGVQPGSPANNGTAGAGSSNFGFSAPVLSLGGRGMGINLSLNYNSLLWHNDGTNISYDIDKGFPGPGWNIGFGKMMDMGSTGGAMLEDIDGTRHSFDGTTVSYGAYSTYYGKTTDGSFIDYQVSRGPSGIYSATALLANGTWILYGAAADGVLYPTAFKDRHGNLMSIAYQNNQGPRITTITDNLNRVVNFNYDGGNRLISVTGPGFNGSTRTYVQLHYTQKTLGFGFTGLTPQVRDNSPWMLDAIYYPGTNTGYWFDVNSSYSSYGMIAKVSERRGMTCSGCTPTNQGTIGAGSMTKEMVYNYPMTAGSLTTAPQYTTMTEDWAGRDVPTLPVTTYSNNNNANPRTTTVTLPNGNQIKQYSYNNPNQPNDGLLYQVETLSPGNQVLGKSVTSWAAGDYGTSRVTQVESTDEKNQTTKQEFTYTGSYNQVATISEKGYSNNLLRKSVNTYENSAAYVGYYTTINGKSVFAGGRHIFSLPKTQEVFADAANTVRLSKSDISYDQATLVNTPGVVMYDQTSNPYNPELVNGGGCLNWEWVDIGYGYENGVWECTEYEQVPNFDQNTLARGNATTTTVYSDAATLSGAIPYVSTYDIVGNVLTTTTNCCQQMAFSYSTATQYSQPDWHRKGSPSDPATQVTESAIYDFNTGAMKTATDFNGLTTAVTYDSVMRPIQTTLPTGGKSVTAYDDLNMKVTQTGMESNNNIVSQGETFLNGRGQTVLSKSLAGAQWNAAQVKYDLMGRQTQTSLPYPATGSPSQWTTYSYDLFSRVTQVTAPDGSISQTIYNDANKPSSAGSNVGNTVRSIDAWGRERWARTDDFGRLVEVVEPDPNGNGSVLAAGNMVTSYQYDPLDQLTLVTQGSQTRAFKYDSLGRLTRQKLAEQANTIEGLWSDAFVYDQRSNLVQRTDARGVKTNFVYNSDPLNRLQSINYDKTQAANPGSIADAPAVSLAYMGTGDKTRVSTVTTAGVSTETNSYDSFSRVQFYSVSMFGKSAMTSEYAYDTANRLTSVTYPNAFNTPLAARVVNPSYDNASRLTQMTVNGQIQMSEIVYNPLSQVTQLKTGAATGNADIEQYSYDVNTGLLTNQKVIKQNSNQTLLDLSYNYNRGLSKGSLNGKTGQLTNIVNNLDRNKDRVYEFDTLGRLTTAKGGGATGVGGVTANWTQNYAFDRYGNRTNVTASGITQNSAAVPVDGLGAMSYNQASNRITNANYEYDPAGNLTRGQAPDGTWQRYVYDAAGRLVAVTNDAGTPIESYAYGASRQRLRTISGSLTTYYAWGGSSVLCEYTENNGSGFKFSKSYIYAGSRLLSTQVWNGSAETNEFHHPDRLGTKLVTNNATNVNYEQSTLPFGTNLPGENVGSINTNQRFTSYDRSTVASLDYAVNRSYSSGQGRFTSVDPIGMSSVDGSPQSLNLYAYVKNNPIDFTDPSGLNANPFGTTYYLDGFEVSESLALRMLGNGSAIPVGGDTSSIGYWEDFGDSQYDSEFSVGTGSRFVLFPGVGNGSDDLTTALTDILSIVTDVINGKNDKNNFTCASILGGKENALKLLNLYKSNIGKALKVGSLSTSNKFVAEEVDPDKKVKAGGGKIPVITLSNKSFVSTEASYKKALSDYPHMQKMFGGVSFKDFWAAVVIHALGHAANEISKTPVSLIEDDSKLADPSGTKTIENTRLVIDSCFPK